MKVNGLEIVNKSEIYSAQTAATGTNWVQLGTTNADQVVIYNDSGTTLSVRYCEDDGTSRAGQAALNIPTGVAQPLRGLKNARNLKIKRADDSNTQVTVSYVVEAAARA